MLSPFRMVCGNFILPEPASYVFFYVFSICATYCTLSKDWLCPDSMEFQKDHFRLNDRWGRVLYLQDYASYIKDSMIAELCDLNRSLMLSIDILTVPTDEAVREIQNKLLGVETNAGATRS